MQQYVQLLRYVTGERKWTYRNHLLAGTQLWLKPTATEYNVYFQAVEVPSAARSTSSGSSFCSVWVYNGGSRVNLIKEKMVEFSNFYRKCYSATALKTPYS